MGKISASNAVVNSIEQVAALYGVRAYRMQSRALMVADTRRDTRPMFMGAWHDRTGVIHRSGMADLLLTPRVKYWSPGEETLIQVAVALWVECKSGVGRLSVEQQLFRADVLAAGAFYLEAHDGPDVVMEWFKNMGVERD